MGISALWLAVPAAAVFFVLYLKQKRDRKLKECQAAADLEGKIVIITGASSGLGLETAYQLAKRKATVILACRNREKAENAVQLIKNRLLKTSSELVPDISVLILDLGSVESVEKFAENFQNSHSKLDILVNNAGIMGAPFSLSADGIESHFSFNHLGHFHLTNLLMENLKKAAKPRIINVSSGYYRKMASPIFENLREYVDYDPLFAYARSKLAQCLHTLQLSENFDKSHHQILVFAVRPGFVRGTDLGRHFSTVFRFLASPLIWFISRNVHQGVQTILHCCLAPESELVSGALYSNCQLQQYSPNLVNQKAAKDFWSLSQKLISEIKSKET